MSRPLSPKKEKRMLEDIWEQFYWANNARHTFMERYQTAFKMYYNDTIDEDDKRLLYERAQSDVTLNYLRILLRKMQSFMTANQPMWTAFAVNDDDRRSAHLAKALLSGIWRWSKGYLQTVEMLKSGTVDGQRS